MVLDEIESIKKQMELLTNLIQTLHASVRFRRDKNYSSKPRYKKCKECQDNKVDKCEHCFKCGSKEHLMAGCKVKTQKNEK